MEENTKDYIRIGHPFLWMFVSALILVFLAGTLWGVVGSVPVSDTVVGYVYESDEILCFMDASRYSGTLLVGNDAVIKTADGTMAQSIVVESAVLPTTAEIFSEEYMIPDWMISSLATGEYMYVISILPDVSFRDFEGQLVEVSIVIDRKKPFELL